jgi:RimJ/RimL family protein N-acetyltransferase
MASHVEELFSLDGLVAVVARGGCRAAYVSGDLGSRKVVLAAAGEAWGGLGRAALTQGVEISQTGELAGDVPLFWRGREYAGAEIGYVFNPRLGGLGYATQAAAMMLQPGLRLAQRVGMRQEARLLENEFIKGEWTTELNFAMLADEWRAAHDRSSRTSKR